MPRPLSPEDGKPRDAPAFLEPGGTRWELPVTVDGTAGTLVIRTFDVEQVRPVTGERYDTEASVRGRAVLLLDAQRKKRKQDPS